MAASAFAVFYTVLFVPVLLALTAVLGWETLRWLWFSVLLVPALTAIGLWGLLPGLPLIGLLLGAIAIRWPARLRSRVLAALLLPVVELVLVRRSGVPFYAGRVLPLLIDARALVLLGTVAPALASVAACLLVPSRWLRRSCLPTGRRDQCPDR